MRLKIYWKLNLLPSSAILDPVMSNQFKSCPWWLDYSFQGCALPPSLLSRCYHHLLLPTSSYSFSALSSLPLHGFGMCQMPQECWGPRCCDNEGNTNQREEGKVAPVCPKFPFPRTQKFSSPHVISQQKIVKVMESFKVWCSLQAALSLRGPSPHLE